jgi:hypothetical protein
MALGMQRARLVRLCSQPTAFCTSYFPFVQLSSSSPCTRKYSIAAVAKKKSEASPKATSAGSKPIPNASVKGSAKATKGPAKPTQGKVAAKPAATTSQPAPTKKTEVTPAPPSNFNNDSKPFESFEHFEEKEGRTCYFGTGGTVEATGAATTYVALDATS